MSDQAMTPAGANPFSPRAALAMVLFGAVVFVAMLWMIGAGMNSGSANDGGNHAAGKGLNGFAAFSQYLEKRGFSVQRARSENELDRPGLLVLTPPHLADGKELDRIVGHRHLIGPTLVILPKWVAVAAPKGVPGAKEGWVYLAGTQVPEWEGFRDDIAVAIGPEGKGMGSAGWHGGAIEGALPDAGLVQSGTGRNLVPLIVSKPGGRILAAYIDDGGDYPPLEKMALQRAGNSRANRGYAPLVMVFEPDLFDNYGMARSENALLAEKLIRAAGGGAGYPVTFDLTLNGHGRASNLLTLAFTPPFLAATLCLLLAALAVGWRAFLRFGPAAKPERAIAFGKTALVANAAGLIRRTRRLHLVSGPYGDSARDRIARALALPRALGSQATDEAIDRALRSRASGAVPFSEIVARLRAARSRYDAVKAARDLHALERTLIR